MENLSFKVGRLVTHHQLPSDKPSAYQKVLIDACEYFRAEPLSVLQTPGGFIRLKFPISNIPSGIDSRDAGFETIAKIVACFVDEHIFSSKARKLLKIATRHLTLGVDVFDPKSDNHAELVGTYNTRTGRFVKWTGKSYPTCGQANSLIYCKDFSSHFQHFGTKRVLVLGCHDLNMFSPRSRTLISPEMYKAKAIVQVQKLANKFHPEIVLHHPHHTDRSKTWATGWAGVLRYLPQVKVYSSGINYEYRGRRRQPLGVLLRKTMHGDVTDYIAPLQ